MSMNAQPLASAGSLGIGHRLPPRGVTRWKDGATVVPLRQVATSTPKLSLRDVCLSYKTESGTRLLFDQLLRRHGVAGASINGYEHAEFTHAAVAAYVASGMADASFGVEAAARQFDLDFVRLVTEDYFFVCRKQILELEPIRRVLAIMRSEEFHAAIAKLPGYTVRDPGAIKTVREAFSEA